MSVAVSKAGPYYASGPISFSSLRQNFRAQVRKESSSVGETFDGNDNFPISISALRRNTTTTDTNPLLPDCTENRASGTLGLGVTTGNNFAVSQFRNTIKFYYITQTGTEVNFDIDNPTPADWNNNLDKNIHKIMLIEGTCGSDLVVNPAATFNATAYNFTIDVHGNIYACGGRGGGTTDAPAIAGENGGTALTMASTGGNNISVNVRSTGKVYGGGGGGEKGLKGANGNTGTCSESTTTTGCGGCPGCPGGWSSSGCWSGGGCDRRQECNWWGNCWWVTSRWTHYENCNRTYTVSGGTGGEGGNGGPGRGYTTLEPADLSGAAGAGGGPGNGCGSTSGQQGETGGTGGEWATQGSGTNNTEDGGLAGSAITGSNYTVTGSINSSTVKGNYPST
jgi:hypothetical protein